MEEKIFISGGVFVEMMEEERERDACKRNI